MADVLSPEEQAAIDAAVAAGKVRRVPPGATAFEMVWCAETKQVRMVDPRLRTPQPVKRPKRAPDPAVAARRARLAELHGLGWTLTEAAAEIGYPFGTACGDAQRLGLRFVGQPGKAGRAVAPEVLERRAAVARLRAEGLSLTRIAVKLGASRATVGRDLVLMGLRPAPCGDEMVARLRALAAEGLTGREAAARLGLSHGQLQRRVDRAGLTWTELQRAGCA